MTKFFKYNKRIVSLQNVSKVELHESESQHSKNGVRYTDHHFSIRITYTNDMINHIDLPDNNAAFAANIFNDIFNELNKE